jgi:branched-chain amino acid transport system substrate-binding protein
MKTSAVAYSRRDLLRRTTHLAGVLAASATLPLALHARRLAPSAGMSAPSLRIGALLPQATVYPRLAESLLAGLQLAFAREGRQVALLVEGIGRGAQFPQPAVDRLLDERRVDVLLGMVNPDTAAALRERLAASGARLVNLPVGANLPRAADDHPAIITHSLALWQASWALGRWAAGQLGRRALLATALYESGYDALYAFRLGFEGAGGTVVATQVTHHPANDDPLARQLDALTGFGPDFVYAAYSGQDAVDFVRGYHAAGLSARLPLIGSSFLADEVLLPWMGAAALGIRTAAPWSPALDTPANRRFVAAYRAQTGLAPDAFALLGYETAYLLAQLDSTLWASAPSFASPRGPIGLDRATQTTTGPLYLRAVRATGAGLVNAILGALPTPAASDPALAALRASVKTGWSTPYLCY